jgi:hypothetical protein
MSKCRTMCKRFVQSVSVTSTTTALVINIPERSYDDCDKLCLLVAQAIPTTATRGLPVVITIGDGTVQYPVVTCQGTPVTQEYIGQNNIYSLRVVTTSTSAVFKVTCNLHCVNVNLQSIPVSTTEGGT